MERCTTHGSMVSPNDPDGLCGTGRVLIEVSRERGRQFARYGTNSENENGTGPGVKWIPAIPAPHTKDPGLRLEEICREDYERTEENGGMVSWMQLVREEVAEAFAEEDPVRLREELLQVAALCVSWIETLDERAASRHGAGNVA